MSSKFTIRTIDTVNWPNKCVTCGEIPTTKYKAYGSALAGYKFKIYGQAVEYFKQGISYPVCLKHKYTTMIIRLIYFASFIAMLFGGLRVFVGIIPIASDMPLGVKLSDWFFFAVSIAAFIITIKLHPVRLKDPGIHLFTIVIRNELYAKEFSLLNNL